MHQLVVHDMVDQPHVEQELTPRVIEVLVGRKIVADVVPRLPPSKEGEPEGERERTYLYHFRGLKNTGFQFFSSFSLDENHTFWPFIFKSSESTKFFFYDTEQI